MCRSFNLLRLCIMEEVVFEHPKADISTGFIINIIADFNEQ
jgi:hypothetical protein